MRAGISPIYPSGFKWSAVTLGEGWDLSTWTAISFLARKRFAPGVPPLT